LVNLFQSVLQFDILNQLQENCLLVWEKELCNFANTIVMEWKAFRLRETYQSLFACWCCNLLDKVRSHSSLNRQKLLEIRRQNSLKTKTIFCFIFFVQILVLYVGCLNDFLKFHIFALRLQLIVFSCGGNTFLYILKQFLSLLLLNLTGEFS
jgi:hypothetical protein